MYHWCRFVRVLHSTKQNLFKISNFWLFISRLFTGTAAKHTSERYTLMLSLNIFVLLAISTQSVPFILMWERQCFKKTGNASHRTVRTDTYIIGLKMFLKGLLDQHSQHNASLLEDTAGGNTVSGAECSWLQGSMFAFVLLHQLNSLYSELNSSLIIDNSCTGR